MRVITGVLAGTANVDMDTAFRMLRGYALDMNFVQHGIVQRN